MTRSIPAAYEPGGGVAEPTRVLATESGLALPAPEGPTYREVNLVHHEQVVWGGPVSRHYGHFLTESVARLWPLLPNGELEDLPVVFTTPKSFAYALDWLDGFGAQLVELPKEGAVRFTRMLVPEPALRHGAWMAPEIRDIHLHARDGMDVPLAERRDVLWLSRSRLARRRVPYDQHLLEWLLDEHVVRIELETLPLAQQIAALESCRAVAGVLGSAFHTLLMTRETPDCLYLCPPWDRQIYPAQQRVLDCDATFAHALTIAASRRRMRKSIPFPGAYRVLIPEALRALDDSVLPNLLDDPRLAAFADRIGAHRGRDRSGDIDDAIVGLLRDPLATEPRMTLGTRFEAAGLLDCALEQFIAVADMDEGHRAAPVRAGRLLHELGRPDEARELERRASGARRR